VLADDRLAALAQVAHRVTTPQVEAGIV